MNQNNKVFVLGLDGASFRVLDPLMKRGEMPNLAKMIEGGVRATLLSTYPPLTPPAWVSFMTGKNPGKHGVYSWLQQIKGEYESRPVDIRKFHNGTLWGYLSGLGRKVGVINVPITYPPLEVNGFIISGMDTPLEDNCSCPADLYHSLLREINDYKVEIDWKKYKNKSKAEFLEDLSYCTKKRSEATLHLMKKFEWDFFVSVFVGMDRIQHFLWEQIENVISGDLSGETERDILKYYRLMDEIIGEVRNRLPDDTVFMIMSDHGFKPCLKNMDLNRWLIENNYLFLKTDKKNILDKVIPLFHYFGINRKRIRSFFHFLKISDPQVMNKISSFSRDLGIIDWEKTRAVCLHPYGIRINLKGREPKGSIEQGDEYDHLVSELKEKLKASKDPDTGLAPVKKAFASKEIYSGQYIDLAPDVIVDFGDTPYNNFLARTDGVEIFPPTTKEQRGCHEAEGVFIGGGNVFRSPDSPVALDMVDIFPTILHIMGLPVPSDVDGRVAEEIIHDSFRNKTSGVPTKAPDDRGASEDIQYRSAEEDGIIEERLRGLGYID